MEEGFSIETGPVPEPIPETSTSPEVNLEPKSAPLPPETPQEKMDRERIEAEEISSARKKVKEAFNGPVNPDSDDFFERLGVSENASKEEIKKAYFEAARKYHPDAGGKEGDFKRINEAFESLYNNRQEKSDLENSTPEKEDESAKYWQDIERQVGSHAAQELKIDSERIVEMLRNAKEKRDQLFKKAKEEFEKNGDLDEYQDKVENAEESYRDISQYATEEFLEKLNESRGL